MGRKLPSPKAPIATPVPVQPPPPQLVPPSLLLPYGGTEQLFPSTTQARARANRCRSSLGKLEVAESIGLSSFVDALAGARTRIWVLDRFYFKRDGDGPPCAADLLLGVGRLRRGVDVRILTSNKNNVGEEYVSGFLRQLSVWCVEGDVEPPEAEVIHWTLGQKGAPEVHDRFAIVDYELWHFGGSVGAVNSGVTAGSRGWSASRTGADSFFLELWEPTSERRRA